MYRPTCAPRPASRPCSAKCAASVLPTPTASTRIPGVEAVAAPVFNFKNEITMAVLVVGVQGMFDTSPEGEVVRCLKRHAEALSVRLGANGEPKVPA